MFWIAAKIPPKQPAIWEAVKDQASAFIEILKNLKNCGRVLAGVRPARRKYELLPPRHPAMLGFNDCLKLEDFDDIMRVKPFYRGESR